MLVKKKWLDLTHLGWYEISEAISNENNLSNTDQIHIENIKGRK